MGTKAPDPKPVKKCLLCGGVPWVFCGPRPQYNGCPRCNGTGIEPRLTQTCRGCAGRGWLPDYDGGVVECQICHGSGTGTAPTTAAPPRPRYGSMIPSVTVRCLHSGRTL